MIRDLQKYSGIRSNRLSNNFYILDGLFGMIGSAIASSNNFASTKMTNELNYQIHKEDLDYNTAMTRAQWERDDNAHQREVADLQEAGLSPIAALNGAQSSSPLGAPSPIAMEAPQIDTNAIVQSILGAAQLEEQKREFNRSAGQKDMEIANDAAKIENDAKSITLQDKKLNNEFHIATETNKLRADEIENFRNQLNETKRYNEEEQRRKEEERLWKEYNDRTKQMYDDAIKNCPEFVGGIKWCFSPEELETAQQSYNTTLNKLIKELGSHENANDKIYTNLGGKLSGGTGQLLPGVQGEINGDINLGMDFDKSDKRRAIIEKYKGELKMPRLVSPEDRDAFDENGNFKYKR